MNIVDKITQEINENPSSPELYEKRGMAYMDASLNSEALADFNTAISLEPLNSYLYIDRGRILLALDRLIEARLDFDKAIELDPFIDEGYSYRAVAAFQNRELRTAASDIEYAISLDPENAAYHHFAARIYANLEQPIQSLEAISRAIFLQPNKSQFFDFRFNLYINDLVCDNEQSVWGDAERAIYLSGESSQVFFGRGLMYFALENWERAICDFANVYKNKNMTWDHARSIVFLILARRHLGGHDLETSETNEILASTKYAYQNLGIDSWPLQAILWLSGKMSGQEVLVGLLADTPDDEQTAGWCLFEFYLFSLLAEDQALPREELLARLKLHENHCRTKYYFKLYNYVD